MRPLHRADFKTRNDAIPADGFHVFHIGHGRHRRLSQARAAGGSVEHDVRAGMPASQFHDAVVIPAAYTEADERL